jgi:hypothetical protein
MVGAGGGASASTGGVIGIVIGFGVGLGAAFFLGLAFFTIRLAFFFAPFFVFPFFAKQSHRRIVEVKLVIKLA